MADITMKETCPGGFWLEARLNNEHRVAELTFSDGSRVCYEYENGKLRRIVRLDPLGRELYDHTYDWDGSKLMSQTGWFTTQYLYDDSNHRVIAKLNPWYQATIEYDSSGKAIRVGDRIYAYDTLGQIISAEIHSNCIIDIHHTFVPVDEELHQYWCCRF